MRKGVLHKVRKRIANNETFFINFARKLVIFIIKPRERVFSN